MNIGHAKPSLHDRYRGGLFVFRPWMPIGLFAASVVLVVSIYCCDQIRREGFLAVVWTDPAHVGVSLYTLVALANALLFVLFGLGMIVARKRSSGRDIVVNLLALALLAGTQAVAYGWKTVATYDLARALERRGVVDERIRAIEDELSRLNDHPWAGEYVSRLEGRELRYWLAPESGFAFIWDFAEYRADGTPAYRVVTSSCGSGAIEIANGDVVSTPRFLAYDPDGWYHGIEVESVVVRRGERRYLVSADWLRYRKEDALAALEGRGDVPFDSLIQLRAGDEAKPASGAPVLPDGF